MGTGPRRDDQDHHNILLVVEVTLSQPMVVDIPGYSYIRAYGHTKMFTSTHTHMHTHIYLCPPTMPLSLFPDFPYHIIQMTKNNTLSLGRVDSCYQDFVLLEFESLCLFPGRTDCHDHLFRKAAFLLLALENHSIFCAFQTVCSCNMDFQLSLLFWQLVHLKNKLLNSRKYGTISS